MDKQVPVSVKQLRIFGLALSAVIVFWSFIFNYWLGNVIAALLASMAFIAPGSLNRFYDFWLKFITIINKIISTSLMSLVFIMVITPTALIGRLVGHDMLRNKTTLQGSPADLYPFLSWFRWNVNTRTPCILRATLQ